MAYLYTVVSESQHLVVSLRNHLQPIAKLFVRFVSSCNYLAVVWLYTYELLYNQLRNYLSDLYLVVTISTAFGCIHMKYPLGTNDEQDLIMNSFTVIDCQNVPGNFESKFEIFLVKNII